MLGLLGELCALFKIEMQQNGKVNVGNFNKKRELKSMRPI